MRILVVEDEQRLAETVRRGLLDEGYVVDVAHDGLTGTSMALHGGYDAVVLDIMLPGRNGYDVLKRLRDADIWTPVLMLTAKDGDYDQVDAFDLGADDYLVKPFSFPVLVARLRSATRRGETARPVTLTCGDLSLDPASRIVRRGETLIDLTPREFALLHFLIRHPDEVVTKSTILANVWDSDYPGSDNLVEVYVGYLRRKIDAPFGTRSLVTARGMGYRLVSGED